MLNSLRHQGQGKATPECHYMANRRAKMRNTGRMLVLASTRSKSVQPRGKTGRQSVLLLTIRTLWSSHWLPGVHPKEIKYPMANVPNSQTLETVQMPIGGRTDKQSNLQQGSNLTGSFPGAASFFSLDLRAVWTTRPLWENSSSCSHTPCALFSLRIILPLETSKHKGTCSPILFCRQVSLRMSPHKNSWMESKLLRFLKLIWWDAVKPHGIFLGFSPYPRLQLEKEKKDANSQWEETGGIHPIGSYVRQQESITWHGKCPRRRGTPTHGTWQAPWTERQRLKISPSINNSRFLCAFLNSPMSRCSFNKNERTKRVRGEQETS